MLQEAIDTRVAVSVTQPGSKVLLVDAFQCGNSPPLPIERSSHIDGKKGGCKVEDYGKEDKEYGYLNETMLGYADEAYKQNPANGIEGKNVTVP